MGPKGEAVDTMSPETMSSRHFHNLSMTSWITVVSQNGVQEKVYFSISSIFPYSRSAILISFLALSNDNAVIN